MARFFALVAESQGAIEGRSKLNSVAAKQMLVYHSSTFPNQNTLRTDLINDPYFSFQACVGKLLFQMGAKIIPIIISVLLHKSFHTTTSFGRYCW